MSEDTSEEVIVITDRAYADQVRWDADVFRDNLSEHYGPATTQVLERIAAYLARGEGVAVYEDSEFSSPGRGDWKLKSFGSPDAQIRTDQPPIRLHDGVDGDDAENWRFVLVGTYRATKEAAREQQRP
jgi:hypothetical protein